MFTISTSLSSPTAPDPIQIRIQAIEDELRILRAQVEVSPVPKHSTASIMPLIDSNIVAKPSDHNRSIISSIANPATFIYQGKRYQAVYGLPHYRSPCTTAPIESDLCAQHFEASFDKSAPLSTVLPSELRVSRSPAISANIAIAKNAISTPQPSTTSIPLVLTSQPSNSTATALNTLRSAASMTSPALSLLFNISQAIPSISLPFSQFQRRSLLPYIRNHARLKPIHCNFQL
jgi:hypothetical protein